MRAEARKPLIEKADGRFQYVPFRSEASRRDENYDREPAFHVRLLPQCYTAHLGFPELDRHAALRRNWEGGKCGNALQAACEGGIIEVVHILLDRGAKANA
ncbi:hypothetical protein BBK36DRAFT_1163191 [Trichoderma citrinoviride]|uniref:Uncharacterized protein n=1 Tax=Trichoderma citrinoviride TaxID=58853 RepID=A0A2T4AYI8_9HYPO|nr:hypothetical protein BBK36DRAFT_1163191 [Trichoderma citrinoviride]PTB62130.1 hypothetical protein BBK36DRAFT_1163191 [Trichoderma citrinoviride]